MNNFCVDRASEYVKNIVDNNRCHLCDRLDGLRLRYTCGHSVCNDCVISAEDCLTCLTPPTTSNSAVKDEDYTKRAKDAQSLLKAFENLFHIDVYKRLRLSDQQKIEKELFPHCIQAPVKYENKRKSLITLSKDKENRRISFFPGENISHLEDSKMENSVSYVEQWLNKNEKTYSRTPFADLNINKLSTKNVNYAKNMRSLKENPGSKYTPVGRKNQKRTHVKTTSKKNLSSLDTNIWTPSKNCPKRAKKDFQVFEDISINKIEEVQTKHDNESGIVIDDEAIVIDDSQDVINDKDKQAWLAVIEASKKDELKATLTSRSDTYNSPEAVEEPLGVFQITKEKLNTKVPFYKKSHIIDIHENFKNEKVITDPEAVKITIESNSFTTTIKLRNCAGSNKVNSKKSVHVQTDSSEIYQSNNLNMSKAVNPLIETKFEDVHNERETFFDVPFRENLPQGNVEINNVRPVQQPAAEERSAVIIEESDTDEELEISGPIHVIADIHRSYFEDDNGVLDEVEDLKAHSDRPRRAPRGYTPTSTDSSDKENYNPNRHKTNKPGHKKYKKK